MSDPKEAAERIMARDPRYEDEWLHDAALTVARAYLDLERDNARMREALTPSGETNADYMGEFSFDVPGRARPVSVPWTTIKDIMAAIRARSALTDKTKETT